jgi:hypothetical protein
MAARNVGRALSVVLAILTVFAVAGCSPNRVVSSPGFSPSPSASLPPSPTPTVNITFDPSVPAYNGTLPAWWEGDKPTTGAWSEGYRFSEQPQTAAEQEIFDMYPDFWAWGVREVDAEIMLPGILPLDDPQPEILVQYYAGVRYEGTPAMPLAFYYHDPMQPAADVIQNTIYVEHPRSVDRNYGRGMYGVSFMSQMTGDPENIIFHMSVGSMSGTRVEYNLLPTFHGITKALDYIRAGDIRPIDLAVPAGQNRSLLPAEYTVSGCNGGDGCWWYNPITDQLVTMTP